MAPGNPLPETAASTVGLKTFCGVGPNHHTLQSAVVFILALLRSEKISSGCGELTGTQRANGGRMNSSTKSEFVVDEEYENEKGIFRVMSIEKDQMVIRWANGEEVKTSIEFQGRIQKRRQWEKAAREETKAAAKPASGKAKSAKRTKKAPSTE
jgi:hypothetical protein